MSSFNVASAARKRLMSKKNDNEHKGVNSQDRRNPIMSAKMDGDEGENYKRGDGHAGVINQDRKRPK